MRSDRGSVLQCFFISEGASFLDAQMRRDGCPANRELSPLMTRTQARFCTCLPVCLSVCSFVGLQVPLIFLSSKEALEVSN